MKKQSGAVLKGLLGKKVFFQGKFQYGEREHLQAMAEAQQATIGDDLDASVTHLVLADTSAGKTVQKKAATLIAKGATIQTLDVPGFEALVSPSDEELITLLRTGGGPASDIFNKVFHRAVYFARSKPDRTISGEKFDGIDLSGYRLASIAFDRCTFVKSALPTDEIATCTECDFSEAKASHLTFNDLKNCKFTGATLNDCEFSGLLDDTDFRNATLTGVNFEFSFRYGIGNRTKNTGAINARFQGCRLNKCNFAEINLNNSDLSNIEGTATWFTVHCKGTKFSGAKLAGSSFVDCKLNDADFSNADLTNVNLTNSDLSNANLAGANLSGAIFRGTKLDGVDLGKARNYDPSKAAGRSAGPALNELDQLQGKARRIEFHFQLTPVNAGDPLESIGIDTNGLRYRWGVSVPAALNHLQHRRTGNQTISGALLDVGQNLPGRVVRFETVDVSSTKSPKGGKELRDLVLNAIAEAFDQQLPDADKLAELTKAYRDEKSEQNAADRERRENLKREAEKAKESEKKKIAKKIAKEVGKVTDIATFLKALELRIEKPKIQKATKMLKASGFKLFNDVAEDHLAGVVKSQTDPDLVYACRIESDGNYACCTQNLNICGGLRGSICKHLLVLVIGLVNAGELDPTEIDGWIAKSASAKPELNKETMGDIFIRYKGAEAGEVDWRPTETVPEDYYAL